MLRVGLTGELGSGKSTVAHLLAQRGAIVFSSDEMARAMMQPGEPVYQEIIARFGPGIVAPSGSLDRHALAKIAFDAAHPRIEELNAIVHPAVIAEQARRISALAQRQPHAIVIVESALLLTTKHAPGARSWRDRFDCIVLVTAPEAVRVQRFIDRAARGETLTPEQHAALEADAHSRILHQKISVEEAANLIIVENTGDIATLEQRVDTLWRELTQRSPH